MTNPAKAPASGIVDNASSLARARGARLGFGILAFAALTLVTYPIARYRIFTGFAVYDDEGYMLNSLKSFISHGSLYDQVFTPYGPVYYEFWGAVFSTLGISVNHDSGRTVTVAICVLSSLLIGLVAWRMTGSIVLGLATQLIVFEALFSGLAAEPMHPAGTIVLLLSATMAFSCFVRDRASPLSMALIGGAVMALILVKINVGIFALAAMALVCVVQYPALARHRWLRLVVEVGFVALPLLLMSSKAGEPWARQYALHVFAAALAVVIALRARCVGRRDAKEVWWFCGGLLIVGVTVLLAILATGTSPSGLSEGLIKLPLRFPDVFQIPLALPNWTFVLDLLALVGALGYWYIARNREARPILIWIWVALVSALSILICLFMGLSVIGLIAVRPMAHILLDNVCFVWVALIQPPGKPAEKTQFARLLLPSLAVLQTLQAFPVAGSQLFWSALLLIPVEALCIENGVRWITFSLGGHSVSLGGHSARRALLAIGAIAATVALLVLSGTQLKQQFDRVRAAYDGSVSLGLPGAEDVHVGPRVAANYQAMVAAIDNNCESFVMLPRMASFYIWTQQEPPAGYNVIGFMFDDADQRKVMKDFRSIDGVCLLENVPQIQWWRRGGAGTPPGPLVNYRHYGFVPIAKFGNFQLLKLKGSASRP